MSDWCTKVLANVLHLKYSP